MQTGACMAPSLRWVPAKQTRSKRSWSRTVLTPAFQYKKTRTKHQPKHRMPRSPSHDANLAARNCILPAEYHTLRGTRFAGAGQAAREDKGIVHQRRNDSIRRGQAAGRISNVTL